MRPHNPPTQAQLALLRYIEAQRHERGCSPSIREMLGAFGWRSTHAAHDHLRALERKGLVRREAGRARTIRATPSGLAALAKRNPERKAS